MMVSGGRGLPRMLHNGNAMPSTEMVVMIAITFCLLGGLVLIVRFLSGWLMHRTLRKAIERDSATAPALIDRIGALDSGRNALGNDDRNGMVLIALAVAMGGFALIAVDDPGVVRTIAGAALFPLLIGAVLLLRRKLLKRELAEEAAGAADRGA
jgi:hypothetical protein